MTLIRAVIGFLLVTVACVPIKPGTPFTGKLPEYISLDMRGSFTLTPEGQLRLQLDQPCRYGKTVTEVCPRSTLDAISVTARTPWDQDTPGTWVDAQNLSFPVDWKSSDLDPLAENAPTAAAQPWSISGAQWQPTAEQAARILKLIGDASDTEVDLVQGGPPPKLEVTTLQIESGALRAGEPSTLLVRIANHGAGNAYRVVATTRSSVDALHGHRLSFGAIKQGADKVRRLQVTVPAPETAADAMLVVAISEGNGFAPPNISKRFPIAPSIAAPALGVRCTAPGSAAAPQLDLDAGQQVRLRCTVSNTGNAAADRVELEVSVAGTAPARSKPQAIAASQSMTFDVPVIVPRSLPVDEPVEITIIVQDVSSGKTAQTKVSGVVRMPKLCEVGQLTRAEYQDKLASLRAALSANALTQAEFDRYDAELVACRK